MPENSSLITQFKEEFTVHMANLVLKYQVDGGPGHICPFFLLTIFFAKRLAEMKQQQSNTSLGFPKKLQNLMYKMSFMQYFYKEGSGYTGLCS